MTRRSAEDLASGLDAAYDETSAADDLNSVRRVFVEVVRDVIYRQMSLPQLSTSPQPEPLFILEADRIGGGSSTSLSMSTGSSGSAVVARWRAARLNAAGGDAKAGEQPDSKRDDSSKLVATRRTTATFKMFTKNFKIFN